MDSDLGPAAIRVVDQMQLHGVPRHPCNTWGHPAMPSHRVACGTSGLVSGPVRLEGEVVPSGVEDIIRLEAEYDTIHAEAMSAGLRNLRNSAQVRRGAGRRKVLISRQCYSELRGNGIDSNCSATAGEMVVGARDSRQMGQGYIFEE